MPEISRTIYDKTKSPFIKICLWCGISANAITLLNHLITLTFGVYCFSLGTYLGMLGGVGVCLVNGFLDYLDGDIARETKQLGKLGIWLDSGFDVIIQNAVMAAIGMGCYKMGLPIWIVLLFLVSNAASNFVSFNYNATFGFDSDKGNTFFRYEMDTKSNLVNALLKNLLDPTASPLGLYIYTYRYWIVLGAITGLMPACFVLMAAITTFKWIAMYGIYAFYLRGDRNLHVLTTLSKLDEESEDFYRNNL